MYTHNAVDEGEAVSLACFIAHATHMDHEKKTAVRTYSFWPSLARLFTCVNVCVAVHL